MAMTKLMGCALMCALGSGVVLAQDDEGSRETFYGIGSGKNGRGAIFGGVRQGSLGYQIGVHNNLTLKQENLFQGTPPPDTQYYGLYRTVPGMGFDVLGFFGRERSSVYVGLGLYADTQTAVGRSPSSGFLYDLGQRITTQGAFSIGVMSKSRSGSSVGFGYHTLLGWNIVFSSRSRTF